MSRELRWSEHVRQVLGLDPLPGVDNRQDAGAAFLSSPDPYVPALGVVVDGVGEKVGDEPAEMVRRREDLSGLQIVMDRDPGRRGQRTNALFLHDGRTKDLLVAIRAHQSGSTATRDPSEASGAVQRFNGLPENQKQDVLNFLRSL